MGVLTPHMLEKAVNDYNTKVFIETGTGRGVGLETALKTGLFRALHSIEIMHELVEAARAKFAAFPQITIHEGHTADILPEILSLYPHEPCFVWLDAHFPGADFGLAGYNDEKDPEKRLPLEKEISLFENRKDVIWADDLRIYTGQQWPHNGEEYFQIPSYATISGLDLSQMHKNYNVYTWSHQEGFLVLLPRAPQNS